MAEKHLMRSSTFLAIREMQIKTTLRFYFIPVRMAEIKNTNDSSCWQGYGAREQSSFAGVNTNLYIHLEINM